MKSEKLGPILNFIDGKWSETRETMANVSPATGETLCQIPSSQSSDGSKAVEAAVHAFATWSKSTIKERADLLERVASEVEKNFEEFCWLESFDTGKPISLCRELDIPRAISNLRFFSQAIQQTNTDFFNTPGGFSYSLRQPLGAVSLITPWNLPLYLLTWKLAPALAMGNTVVAKPSELTPLTAHRLAQVFFDIKAPAGIFNVVHGLGIKIGEPLVKHPLIKAISFTGGTSTGRRVSQIAAESFKKTSLEMGGKNPTVIFSECDLEKAVKGVARASFLNQGQICLCGSRIYVEKNIYKKFIELFVAEVKSWKVGDPSDSQTQFGALISAAHLAKVEKYVTLAKDEGGNIAFGGTRATMTGANANGFFFLPTIITDIPDTCRAAQEEIFGPVVTVHTFDSEAEVIESCNQLNYGLSASIWTENLARAHRVAHLIEAGTVWVNTWLMRDLRVPFGGVKESGTGREGGKHSLDFFSEMKTVCVSTGENL
jgi:aminomuconate-semialdehyde/2-hydroxymuconate-6-semialdehyde dehydrogenase